MDANRIFPFHKQFFMVPSVQITLRFHLLGEKKSYVDTCLPFLDRL